MTKPDEQEIRNASESPVPQARRWGPVAWYTMGLAVLAALTLALMLS